MIDTEKDLLLKQVERVLMKNRKKKFDLKYQKNNEFRSIYICSSIIIYCFLHFSTDRVTLLKIV